MKSFMSPRKRARLNPASTSSVEQSTESPTESLPATLPYQSPTGLASQVNNVNNPAPAPAEGTRPTRASTTTTTSPPEMPTTKRADTELSNETRPNGNRQVRKSRSWYGSWPRVPKSSPSTQVARENIAGTLRPSAIPDFSRFEMKKPEPPTDSDAQSIRTLHNIPETDTKSATLKKDATQPEHNASEGESIENEGPGNPVINKSGSLLEETRTTAAEPPQTTASPGWLAWLARPSEPISATDPVENMEVDPPKETEVIRPQTPLKSLETPPELPVETPKSARPTSSWFGFWTSSTNTTEQPTTETIPTTDQARPKEAPDADVVMQDAPSPTPAAGSTWAFWSRDASRDASQKQTTQDKSMSEQGELAVIGDGSESSPRRSNGVEISNNAEPPNNPPAKPTKGISAKSKRSKRVRPQSMDIDEPLSTRPGTPQSDGSANTAPTKPATPDSTKIKPDNLLLPSFRGTYHMKDNPSIIKQIAQLLLRTQQPSANHVFLAKEPPKIKKAIAIGVHGLFPASYLRPMIGQPTGTSIRFANHCVEAIRRWTESHGCGDCEIEKVALEGEGKIAERVDNLWKLLLNWIEHIRSADLIVVACHSQGVPVALMLLAKLIDLGIITNARIGVCAMAGVSLGPFPDYKSGMGMLMGSAAELWQFGDPESEISKRYRHALEVVVNYGARVTYVGSIDDQLVPMESAVYSPASHPYIYRAVFIDGRIHAPDFIAHLVGFALKLRNLGISDHGLIRELSVPLAGSLYSGEGHSRLYDDEQVYDLAVSHTLETTSVSGLACQIQKHDRPTNPNPYILPWIMRGLLEEEFVKTELYSETTELLKQFDEWTPTTKALKDVKYRLEAVRSKL
ncbi:hypothetical protein F4778DRAFT_724748 [Xylariomycetidae sp. FL2044]|nr:hypothetical protein F4778DRAFT_724748 [Xylariomycetidae sp. FL2044]